MKATLSCCEYRVSVVDRQVIFTECVSVWSYQTSFTLERPVEINNTGGIWYLVEASLGASPIPISHIVEAVKWCEEHFGKSFEPYKGELKLP